MIPGVNDYFPHVFRNRYIHCDMDRRAFVKSCPPKTHWNQLTKTCLPESARQSAYQSTYQSSYSQPMIQVSLYASRTREFLFFIFIIDCSGSSLFIRLTSSSSSSATKSKISINIKYCSDLILFDLNRSQCQFIQRCQFNKLHRPDRARI